MLPQIRNLYIDLTMIIYYVSDLCFKLLKIKINIDILYKANNEIFQVRNYI